MLETNMIPTQRWTWVGSIYRSGWVESHFPAHVMGWAGLNEKHCYFFIAFCVCYSSVF